MMVFGVLRKTVITRGSSERAVGWRGVRVEKSGHSVGLFGRNFGYRGSRVFHLGDCGELSRFCGFGRQCATLSFSLIRVQLEILMLNL